MLFYAKAYADLPGCTPPVKIPNVDPNKSIVVKYTYDAWGKPIESPWDATCEHANLVRLNDGHMEAVVNKVNWYID